MSLSVWKFMIGTREVLGGYSGCVAAVVAVSQEDALALLRAYAKVEQLDPDWLNHARIVRIPVESGAVITWARV